MDLSLYGVVEALKDAGCTLVEEITDWQQTKYILETADGRKVYGERSLGLVRFRVEGRKRNDFMHDDGCLRDLLAAVR